MAAVDADRKTISRMRKAKISTQAIVIAIEKIGTGGSAANNCVACSWMDGPVSDSIAIFFAGVLRRDRPAAPGKIGLFRVVP